VILVGSLFSGAGGLDLGLERAGMRVVWQVEKNRQCRSLLRRHWPNADLYEDVCDDNPYSPVGLVCGGDPCPIRSRARGSHGTKVPDLSGYFLAVVARVRPRWVVRENVPAPDDVDFYVALEALGYGCVIVNTNAKEVAAQNRTRDFVVGCLEAGGIEKFASALPVQKDGEWAVAEEHQAAAWYPTLTTHPCRWDARDGYIWDGTGLRVADREERTALAGFPRGWFDGLSNTAVARMTGNAVVPRIAELIGNAIVAADDEIEGLI